MSDIQSGWILLDLSRQVHCLPARMLVSMLSSCAYMHQGERLLDYCVLLTGHRQETHVGGQSTSGTPYSKANFFVASVLPQSACWKRQMMSTVTT